MLRIARFIKPFIASVALAVILLFVQALCDLNLPNLMSNIVNVGIQQGGVEDRSPVAISSEGHDLVETFMDSSQRELFNDSYELVFPNDTTPSGKPWSDQYPDASTDGFYVLKSDIDANRRTELDSAFGVATGTMIHTLQEFAENGVENLGITLPPEALEQLGLDPEAVSAANGDPNAPANQANGENNEGSNDLTADLQNIDFSAVYDALPLLQMIPSETMAGFRAQAVETDELMLQGSSTMLIRNFYKELGVNMDSYEVGYIVRVGLIMLLITVIGGAATILVGLLSSRIGAGFARDLRSAVFKKVLAFSHTEFDRFSTASLITRSTNDVTQIQMLLTLGIRMLFYAPIMGIGAIIMALRTSVGMSWIMGIAVLFMLCMVSVLIIIVMPKFKIIQKLIDKLNLVARETLVGQMVVRAFSRERFEMDRFEKANADVTKTNLFIQRAMVFMMPLLMIFMNALTVLIIWVGAEQVAASQIQVGDMMAFMQYAMMMVMSFMFMAMAFVFIPRAAVSAGRIADVLETEPIIADPENPVTIPDTLPAQKRGRVELRNVSFKFEGAEAYALENINLVAEAGSTTAIIGSTGSGKSSILNLIPRFYDANEGEVLFDGVDVKKLAAHDLRSRIGYVPQKSLLMSGTVAENIAYGRPDLPPEDIEKVAEIAQAADFINALQNAKQEVEQDKEAEQLTPSDDRAAAAHTSPDPSVLETQAPTSGYDFEIAQGGSNVSGGQRQRLAIARALAMQPEIFLFDDSFSALDFATDAALRKALATYTHEATLLIVAQRVGTIMDADIIYVLDEGTIIGQGTHAELLQSCAAYKEIAESQLSPEEIAASMDGDAQ